MVDPARHSQAARPLSGHQLVGVLLQEHCLRTPAATATVRPIRSSISGEVTYGMLGLEGQASGSLVEDSRVEAEGHPT